MWLFLGLSMLAIVIFGERPTEALIRVRLCVIVADSCLKYASTSVPVQHLV